MWDGQKYWDAYNECDACNCEEYVVDLSLVRFAYPEGICSVASLIESCGSSPFVSVKVRHPRENDVKKYLTRMDFYDQLGIPVDKITRYDRSDKLIELQRMNRRDGQCDVETSSKIRKVLIAQTAVMTVLFKVLYFVLENLLITQSDTQKKRLLMHL